MSQLSQAVQRLLLGGFIGTEGRDVRWVYLVLFCGLAVESSRADFAGVQLITDIGCQVAVGGLYEGDTVLRGRNNI